MSTTYDLPNFETVQHNTDGTPTIVVDPDTSTIHLFGDIDVFQLAELDPADSWTSPLLAELHDCHRVDDGRPVKPLVATCGGCGESWCERCDPGPASQCHWCNGRGYSTAPARQVTS